MSVKGSTHVLLNLQLIILTTILNFCLLGIEGMVTFPFSPCFFLVLVFPLFFIRKHDRSLFLRLCHSEVVKV